MSALLDFFAGEGRDGSNRSLDEILEWNDRRLEAVHDYIQWLFPLPERSGANPWAPVLTPAEICAFAERPELRMRLRAAHRRMLAFYGFSESAGALERLPHFREHAENWLSAGNHNHLRITRMLRSLRLLGLPEEASSFWRALEALYREEMAAGRFTITEQSFSFWRRAATEPLEAWR